MPSLVCVDLEVRYDPPVPARVWRPGTGRTVSPQLRRAQGLRGLHAAGDL